MNSSALHFYIESSKYGKAEGMDYWRYRTPFLFMAMNASGCKYISQTELVLYLYGAILTPSPIPTKLTMRSKLTARA